MQSSKLPPDGGSALRYWPLFALALASLVGLFLALRPGAPEESRRGQTPADRPPPQRSGYENRAVWSPGGPGAAARAEPVTGAVYDVSGAPVQGAHVRATTFEVAGNQSATAGEAVSDERGEFRLRLRDGTYYLTAEKEGFGPSIAVAHSGDEIGLVLRQSGVVTGHVKDEQGRPVARFTLDVVGPTTDDLAAPAPFASKPFDSPDGSFSLGSLPDKAIFLRASAAGFAPAVSSIFRVEADKTAEVDLTLEKGCSMKGTVEDDDGRPLADVFVDAELRRAAGSLGSSTVDLASQTDSDEDGRFELSNVPVGDVLVRAYDGAHAVTSLVIQVETCAAIEPVRIRMSAGGSLSGLVKSSDGSPVAGAKVTVSQRAAGFVNATTDAEGRYRVDRLPAGSMRVTVRRGDQRAEGLVTLHEGDSAEKDFTFAAAGDAEIRGRVTAGDRPLPGMQVLVVANHGSGVMNMRSLATAQDGSYRAAGLPPGAYAVMVSAAGRMRTVNLAAGAVETLDVDIGAKRDRPTLQQMLDEAHAEPEPDEPPPAPAAPE